MWQQTTGFLEGTGWIGGAGIVIYLTYRACVFDVSNLNFLKQQENSDQYWAIFGSESQLLLISVLLKLVYFLKNFK